MYNYTLEVRRLEAIYIYIYNIKKYTDQIRSDQIRSDSAELVMGRAEM
jgi:hypothetical protein